MAINIVIAYSSTSHGHTNEIVSVINKVIRGCSEGQFGQKPPFGRFECDYRDVCSRIDYLISNGYIRRNESNLERLVYRPDQHIATTVCIGSI